jgi:hypothetical protein
VTKLGQKPFTQLKSLLQLLWLMRRLRPNSVSTGSTDRQLLCTLQSPQPSHTSSLMTTRCVGVGQLAALAAAALLGGAGLVVDQAVVPSTFAQLALDAVELVAVVHGDAGLQRHALVLQRVVADDDQLGHAFG